MDLSFTTSTNKVTANWLLVRLPLFAVQLLEQNISFNEELCNFNQRLVLQVISNQCSKPRLI